MTTVYIVRCTCAMHPGAHIVGVYDNETSAQIASADHGVVIGEGGIEEHGIETSYQESTGRAYRNQQSGESLAEWHERITEAMEAA